MLWEWLFVYDEDKASNWPLERWRQPGETTRFTSAPNDVDAVEGSVAVPEDGANPLQGEAVLALGVVVRRLLELDEICLDDEVDDFSRERTDFWEGARVKVYAPNEHLIAER